MDGLCLPDDILGDRTLERVAVKVILRRGR